MRSTSGNTDAHRAGLTATGPPATQPSRDEAILLMRGGLAKASRIRTLNNPRYLARVCVGVTANAHKHDRQIASDLTCGESINMGRNRIAIFSVPK